MFQSFLCTCEPKQGYTAPLHFFYMYCIDKGISDLTRLEQDLIDDYFNKAKEIPLVKNRYHQIVDKAQRILFLQAKDINCEANLRFLAQEKLAVDQLTAAEIDLYMSKLQEENVETIS